MLRGHQAHVVGQLPRRAAVWVRTTGLPNQDRVRKSVAIGWGGPFFAFHHRGDLSKTFVNTLWRDDLAGTDFSSAGGCRHSSHVSPHREVGETRLRSSKPVCSGMCARPPDSTAWLEPSLGGLIAILSQR